MSALVQFLIGAAIFSMGVYVFILLKNLRRDYFASLAMQAEMVGCVAMVAPANPNETAEERIARAAYRMADAMLKARKA